MTRRRSRTRKTAHSRRRARGGTVGYAVVGLGYIAQAAVLPAFAHARRNSRLVALVSGDIRAILESARTGRPVALDEEFERHKRPNLALETRRPPVPGMPPLVRASRPSGS